MNTKKLMLATLVMGLAAISMAYAQQIVVEQPTAPPVASSQLIPWASNGGSDKVTIENGNGASLNIVINVNDDASPDPAGINVQNCGDTKHIDAGSSAICVTSDSKNPVMFSSDEEYAATGTYQITQQLPKQ
jgi:hypothetical protein